MVETSDAQKADRKKQLGNQEFKIKAYDAAIMYYTESIELSPAVATYSNRAASFIAKQDFKHALDDCQAAIRLDPEFARTYKRLYKAHLALGNVEQAKSALEEAVTREPNDPTNKEDSIKMAEVVHQSQMIEKYGGGDVGMSEDQDFEKAASYCNSILKNCIASLNFAYLKIEYLLRSYQLEEADKFSSKLYNESTNIPRVMSWRGRVCIYNGNEVLGRKILTQAIQFDPDQIEAAKALKAIKVATTKKEASTVAFKANSLEEAIQLFDECLALDPLSLNYNAILLLNKSIAQTKLKQMDASLASLNLCIKMNPKYAKALVKRGEVNVAAEAYDEAVSDFAAAKALTDDFGVESKLKQAQSNQKKAKNRDYYKDLGVAKTATDKEIKTAYRKLALKWHPDRNAENEEQMAKAKKQFMIINDANTILSDPEKRKKHDMGMSGEDIDSGAGGMGGMGGMGGGMGGINPEDLMKMFMGMGGMGGGGAQRGGGMGGGGMGGMGGMPPGFSFDMGGGGAQRGGGQRQSGGGNPFGF